MLQLQITLESIPKFTTTFLQHLKRAFFGRRVMDWALIKLKDAKQSFCANRMLFILDAVLNPQWIILCSLALQ